MPRSDTMTTDRPDFLAGLLLSPALPARACRGPWRALSYWPSLGVHFLGLLLLLVGLAVMGAWWWHGDLFGDLFRADADELKIIALGAVIWLAFIQFMFLLAAFATMCWGAGVEPWGQSFGRSLCRWYQLTPFLAVATLGFMTVVILVEESQRFYYDRYAAYAGGWDWHYQFNQLGWLLSTGLFVGLTLWTTLAVLAVHSDHPRWHPRCRWPAVCEACGYALVGLQVDQSCPECGRPVRDSLHTPRGSLRHGTLALMVMALFQPTHLGRHLLTRTRTPGSARALLLVAVGLFLSGPAGIAVTILLNDAIGGYNEFYIDDAWDLVESFIYVGGISGIFIALGGVLLVLGVGSVVATIDRMFGRRDLMPVACQAACYAGGLLVAWSMLTFALSAVLGRVAESLYDAGRYDLADWLGLVVLAFQLAMLTFYLVLVGRIVWPARYANV